MPERVDLDYLTRWADSLERAAAEPNYYAVADICREKADHLRRAIAALTHINGKVIEIVGDMP
jgi:hypothetical protein